MLRKEKKNQTNKHPPQTNKINNKTITKQNHRRKRKKLWSCNPAFDKWGLTDLKHSMAKSVCTVSLNIEADSEWVQYQYQSFSQVNSAYIQKKKEKKRSQAQQGIPYNTNKTNKPMNKLQDSIKQSHTSPQEASISYWMSTVLALGSFQFTFPLHQAYTFLPVADQIIILRRQSMSVSLYWLLCRHTTNTGPVTLMVLRCFA